VLEDLLKELSSIKSYLHRHHNVQKPLNMCCRYTFVISIDPHVNCINNFKKMKQKTPIQEQNMKLSD